MGGIRSESERVLQTTQPVAASIFVLESPDQTQKSADWTGAGASAAIYSIIETAKANGLEPYWYLKHLFENLPEAMSDEDFQALLPQQIEKDQITVPLPWVIPESWPGEKMRFINRLHSTNDWKIL